ncbi:MAG: septation protein A [Rhizobiales bacterium]|nr:septation protein A [Hyphomicrobiales bacterium]MBI3672945.1 septation protein A [Hyphomicrobiales bacterium]
MKTPIKLAIELGPLLAFFAANWLGGVFVGTAVFMVAVTLALIASWLLTHRLAPVPLVSAGFVAVFGALTLWLHDQTFIQVKVTLINVMFGATLLGGLAFGRSYIKLVMDTAMHMPDAAWRTLTIRWGLFFLALALLNEVLRQALTWDQWLNFKVFGILPLTFLFAIANAPFMAKHMAEDQTKPLS